MRNAEAHDGVKMPHVGRVGTEGVKILCVRKALDFVRCSKSETVADLI